MKITYEQSGNRIRMIVDATREEFDLYQLWDYEDVHGYA
jgi:hypothetical protein